MKNKMNNKTKDDRIKEILVKKDNTIKECMKIINKCGLRTAFVVDDNQKLIGAVTDGDIRRGLLKGLTLEEETEKVMNSSPIYASINDDQDKIINLFKNNKGILVIPLVDENRIVKDCVTISYDNSISYFNKTKTISFRNIEKILVIGGAGYIGSVLVHKLLSKGYKVNVLDIFLFGKESLSDIWENKNLRIIEGDTRHIEDVIEAIRDADAVVHLAELVGDPACDINPQRTIEINYFATRMIATLCKHFLINRMIYASSCSVYGASKGDELLTEESELNPVSLYAKTKIASEKALKELSDDYFRPTILRLSTVFGFSYRPRFDLIVNTLTAKASREGKITIFGGEQWRPNVHVSDVADTIIAILESPIEKVGGEIFNVGSEENNYKIKEIGELVNKEFPNARIIFEDKIVDKRDYRVCFKKLKTKVGIKMKFSVRDGIREMKDKLNEITSLNPFDNKYNNVRFLENNKQIKE